MTRFVTPKTWYWKKTLVLLFRNQSEINIDINFWTQNFIFPMWKLNSQKSPKIPKIPKNPQNPQKILNIFFWEFSKIKYFPKIFHLIRIRFYRSFFDSSTASWRTRRTNTSWISDFANLTGSTFTVKNTLQAWTWKLELVCSVWLTIACLRRSAKVFFYLSNFDTP